MMTEQYNQQISKILSLVLRHQPGKINIVFDKNGWADVDELINKMNHYGHTINFDLLEEVVVTNDKQRFSFDNDLKKIRANQGHSIAIDLSLNSMEPPAYLYHGTAEKFVTPIRQKGIQKINRQYVHLSHDIATAEKVGSRRGNPIILTIAAGKMFKEGYLFFFSENGVWLCNDVPPKYIQF